MSKALYSAFFLNFDSLVLDLRYEIMFFPKTILFSHLAPKLDLKNQNYASHPWLGHQTKGHVGTYQISIFYIDSLSSIDFSLDSGK